MSKLKLTPIGGNILVKAISVATKSASGIVLPDSMNKEKPQRGEVVALGSGKIMPNGNKIAFSVKAGDVVLFKKYSPDEVEVDGETYLIMDEDAILAIIA